MKTRPLGAEFCSMRTDGQSDMTKVVVAFRSFANALETLYYVILL